MLASGLRAARNRASRTIEAENFLEPTKDFYKRQLVSDLTSHAGDSRRDIVMAPTSEVDNIAAQSRENDIIQRDQLKRVEEFHKRVRILHSRKPAVLPRKHWMVIQNGPALQMQDLSIKAPSIFPEDDGKVEQLLQRMDGSSYDPLDESSPFWKTRAIKRKVDWQLPERPSVEDNSIPALPERVILDEANLEVEIQKADASRKRRSEGLVALQLEAQTAGSAIETGEFHPFRVSADVNGNKFPVTTGGGERSSGTSSGDHVVHVDNPFSEFHGKPTGRRRRHSSSSLALSELSEQLPADNGPSSFHPEDKPAKVSSRRGRKNVVEGIEPETMRMEVQRQRLQDSQLSGLSPAWQQAATAGITSQTTTGDSQSDTSSATQFRVAKEHARRVSERLDPGAALISQLKQQALAGAHEHLRDDQQTQRDVEMALAYYPGADFARRMTELKTVGEVESVESLLASGKASVENFNLLMKAQSLRGELKVAMKTLQQMGQLGFPPNQDSFVSVLQGCVAKRDPATARMVYLRMRSLGLAPSEKVYATLIKAHVAGRDLNAAFALAKKMEDEGMKWDVVVVTALVDGCVKARDFKKAWEVFREARTWRLVEPDEVLFNVMIKASAYEGKTEQAFNMLDDMRDSKLQPIPDTYFELIRACANTPTAKGEKPGRYLQRASDLVEEMRAQGMPVEHRVLSQMLAVCASAGDLKKAKKVVQELRKLGGEQPVGKEEHRLLLRTLANSCRLRGITDSERSDAVRHAWLVIRSAQDLQVGVDVHLLNELLHVYAAAGFSKHAVDMLEQFEAYGAAPNTRSFSLLLKMLGRDLQDPGRFFTLFDFMKQEAEKSAALVVANGTSAPAPSVDPETGVAVPSEDRALVRVTPGVLHLALDVAMDSKSASRVVEVLETMVQYRVWPTADLAERLSKLAAVDRSAVLADVTRRHQLVNAQMQEHALREAAEGRTPQDKDMEKEIKKDYFKSIKENTHRKVYSKQELQQIRKKGGALYAEKADRPKPAPYRNLE